MSQQCRFEQVFDAERNLQYVNGEVAVLHCHHYATIFTKLALDNSHLDGPRNLVDAMEETAHLTLRRQFIVDGVKSPGTRRTLAEQYFALAGLGQLSLQLDETGGTASMAHSHVDEGWLKKWGIRRRPVNLVGCGFLAGATAAIYDQPIGSYRVRETQSIVSGAETSEFTIQQR